LFVTVTNTGPETITGYIVTPPGEQFALNITTGQVCQFQTYIGATRSCAVSVAPATSAQICFAGSAPELYPGLEMFIQPAVAEPYRIKASVSPVAPPCPFSPSGAGSGSTSAAMPGSGSTSGASATPGSGSAGGASGARGSKGAHSWSRALCKSTYKAWTKAHRRATRLQKKAEASKLHKAHGCPLSILK
jgi:hypothetical protein